MGDDGVSVVNLENNDDSIQFTNQPNTLNGEQNNSTTDSMESPPSIDESEGEEAENLEYLIQELVNKLSPGNTVPSIDDAYLLYCEYARLLGFSVKRGTQAYFQKTDVVRMKMFFCSAEGRTDNRASNMRIACYKKQHIRTACRARLRINRSIDGPWIVSVFETQHNHDLLGPDDSYLLRSSRNLSIVKRSILETFNDAGIGVSKAFKFVRNQAGGPQNVGYIKNDAYDHMDRTRKVTKLGNADAEALMEFFFWRVLLDDDGRIMNVYFRDSRCAKDYATFGDVVSMDTTFRTNKYNLICAPFVGMNHHRHTTMFGMGFLSDESHESFEWLFNVFLESMDGEKPQIIFSDQDQTLMNGVDYAFHTAAHRLCQWHVNQNAPAHFGKLNGDKEFKEMWFKCMNKCADEEEFESVWTSMIALYDLQSNSWFTSMYQLRKKWADCFTRDRFSGGMHATSRSELTNKVIKDMCAASTSLIEFVNYFERIVNDWRIREREEDALCRGTPGQCIGGNNLMQQAANIYTRSLYKIFEHEAMMSLNVSILQSPDNMEGGTLVFKVLASGSKNAKIVTYKPLSEDVHCTCSMLTTHGMFCKNVLKVFYTMNVQSLPKKYILHRWTREAKSQTSMEVVKEYGHHTELLFVNELMRMTYNIALEWKGRAGARKLVMETMHRLTDELRGDTVHGSQSRSKNKGSTLGEHAACNPPSPEHRWLPPKRRPSAYLGKRKRTKKNKVQNNDKGNKVTSNTSKKEEV